MPNVAAGPAVAAPSLFRFVLAISNKRVGLGRQLESQDICSGVLEAGQFQESGAATGQNRSEFCWKVNGVYRCLLGCLD